ncbi:MAG: MBL fold metallo-hydrolase [Oscillospiraceae bacterium]|nr:MBL fold metallo-hydrolase [Oscillospiraceae bacterium]
MRLTVFASGSGGNCLLLSGGGTNILIDAGLSTRRLSAMLGERCLSLQDIGGVLITHEHSDHISGLGGLLRRSGAEVLAPRTVAARLRGMLPQIDERLRVIPVGEDVFFSRLTIRAFHTPHDTDESVGYRIACGGIFSLATDMGCVTDEVRENLRGSDVVLIEANHDEEMLRYGGYPVYLKRRILSDRGHLSNKNCAALARELAESGTGTIILGHLSRENNTPDTAMRAVRSALEGTGARLLCAPPLGPLEVKVERACCRSS